MEKTNIDFDNLGFNYIRTAYNLRCVYRDGKWGEITLHTEETIPMHISAGCLHYGQESFEGLKAFACPDGKVRIFRPDKNAERMQSSARYVRMAEPPTELFVEMCRRLVEMNRDFIPPFESGGSLYIRPLLIGTGPTIGVKAVDEYMLLMFCTPVGEYFKGGMKGIRAIVDAEHDRAAPHGTGHVKVGGNYAASLESGELAHAKGYESALYLDPATHTNIDECGAANFFGIKGNTYVTPNSHSVLPSITNLSLRDIARYVGMDVECRDIPVSELSEFEECGACGTAAVIAPIEEVFDPRDGKKYSYHCVGDKTMVIYQFYKDLQVGLREDQWGWNVVIE
ncbi:MAG: branched-chain amino acid aminotransferase [Rikenellaceae bacterium]